MDQGSAGVSIQQTRRWGYKSNTSEVILRLVDMGVEHIILSYDFLHVGRNVDKMIDTTK